MKPKQYKIKSEVWLYPSEKATWYFIGVDKKDSEEIKEKYGKLRRGFGSIPVEVTVGKTTWKTSIFPNKRTGAYILPLKAGVRRREGIFVKDIITFKFRVR